MDASDLRPLLTLAGGSLRQVYSWPSYFETFERPVGGDPRFGGYFQNSDLHPWGRHYLREQAYVLGMTDALHYAIGFQPLGSWGAEDEVREFTQAYCALPAIPFKDVPGSDDPVVARTCPTKNGTYVYAVNLHHLPVTAKFDVRLRALDLSTDETLETDEVPLKPYQLRSFLVRDGQTPSRVTSVLSEEACTCYRARAAEIDRALVRLTEVGVDCAAAKETANAAAKAVSEGKLARAHRLYFSRALNGVFAKTGQMENVIRETQMHKAGRWAVNCGSTSYSVIDGKLFSPDKPWDGQTYGRFGECKMTVNRDITTVREDAAVREVYATEAYDVDGYRFRLPPGRYHVVIRAKWGYGVIFDQPNPAVFCEYKVNGWSVAGMFDFYKAQKGELKNVLDLSCDAAVGADGILEITLNTSGAKSARLINAIEITRQ